MENDALHDNNEELQEKNFALRIQIAKQKETIQNHEVEIDKIIIEYKHIVEAAK